MAFFHHETTKKYTLALLSTFNDIETQYLASDGITLKTNKVPIKFSSREKATIFDEVQTSEILRGNFNILPRMSLIFNGMERNPNRAKNKFQKINKLIQDKTIEYTANSIPYDFSYTIICQARGMSEASMIVEQLASHFNPTYTLRINEIPLQSEPTDIVIDLNGINIESEEYEEFSTNIVNISIDLVIRGNIYPAIKNQELVENIKWYLNTQVDDEYSRASLIEFNGTDTELSQFGPKFGTNVPVISGITRTDNISDISLTVNFEDKDNKIENNEFTYIWSVISGINTIGTSSETVTMTNNPETTSITVTVLDIHGNQSNTWIEDIVV